MCGGRGANFLLPDGRACKSISLHQLAKFMNRAEKRLYFLEAERSLSKSDIKSSFPRLHYVLRCGCGLCSSHIFAFVCCCREYFRALSGGNVASAGASTKTSAPKLGALFARSEQAS